MDDLDHSIHIAEFDWTIFYDESEECSLLQPSLACPDDSRLSDSEDSENLGSKSTTGQQETEHSPDVNSFGVDSNSAGCSTGEEACIKLDESSSRGEQGAEDRVTQVDSETCLGHPAGKTNEVHKQTAENTVQTETAVPEELKKDGDNGDLHTETNNSSNESNLLFVSQTELHMNEPLATDRAVREDWSSVTPRAEKERWFVTVNDSPSRRQTHASSVKKKRRQKKLCKNSATTATNMCNYRRNRREKSLENGLELEINKHKNDSEGDRDTGDLTQSNHKMVQMSDRHHSDATNPDSISDLSQMSCDEDSMSDKLLISDSPKEIETIEPVIDRNKHEPGSSASTSHDTFTLTDPSQLESAMSDEVEDAAEFFSIHSYDSESYLSAAESMEETQHALLENLRHVDLIHSQCSESLVESAVTADKGQTHTCDSVPSCNVSATDCDSYEHTDVEPTLPFLYADQKANEMPDDNSTCDNKTHSTVPHMLSDTPGAQEHKINFSASGCSSGDQLSLFSVPDLTLTPCSVADNPEAYAEAAGNTRPVYAISAFWDEMEKLTINDILQLRMGRSSSLTDTRETVSADVDDSLTSQSPLTDTAQYNLSDVGLMDTSDTADSDYFTQTDESKPDRSSCEFSTSDFDEEYWQFLGTSENSSPDPHSKNQTSDCPSLSYEEEEEESTSSEGKETPVPSEDFAGQGFEDQESNSLSKLDKMGPQHMTKSKSMYNIQALNKEDLISSFGDNNNSLFLSSCQSLEKNMVLKVNDNLGTPIPEPFLSTYSDELWKMSYPEVFEYFFMEDRAKTDSTCVSVYNPEDISVFDCTFGTLRDDMSFFSLRDSLCREEKPIPIFSSIREITLPQSDCVFLSADCEVGDLSPIKVVSCAFIQGNGCGAAAGGSHGWKSLLSMRKIRFHDKGSIWCRRSGGWVFPVEAEKTEKKDPLNSVLTEGRICTTSPQLFTDLTVQQSILQTIQTTRREGIFSTLKQSDMCLVCIAFASWVLRSSDPEAADTWKAALLANVSALSAIQYLRQYVKKKSPPQDHP